jgi:uncharacterized protein YoxC
MTDNLVVVDQATKTPIIMMLPVQILSILICIAFLILAIIMVVKFFKLTKDISAIKKMMSEKEHAEKKIIEQVNNKK